MTTASRHAGYSVHSVAYTQCSTAPVYTVCTVVVTRMAGFSWLMLVRGGSADAACTHKNEPIGSINRNGLGHHLHHW
jgi:hypothetical protein